MLSTDGRATSASTSITVLSSSMAMLMARLIAVKSFLARQGAGHHDEIAILDGAAPLPMALSIKGRLMTRYSSAAWERGVWGPRM